LILRTAWDISRRRQSHGPTTGEPAPGGTSMRSVWVLLAFAALAAADDKERSFRFTKDDAGKLPAGWKTAQTGNGKSEWKDGEDETAPSKSGYVLAQTRTTP